MRNVNLQIEDNIYSNVMFILNNLKVDGLKIQESKIDKKQINQVDSIKKLFSSKENDCFKSIDNAMQWQDDIRNEW